MTLFWGRSIPLTAIPKVAKTLSWSPHRDQLCLKLSLVACRLATIRFFACHLATISLWFFAYRLTTISLFGFLHAALLQ
jgi:hypothetical protein